jgi:hypothetical protein
MVKVTVMGAAALLADSVRVLVPMVAVGLKDAVTPLGKPGADRLTLLLKPPDGVTLIVLVPLEPCARVRLLGDAIRLKSGFCTPAAFTVRLSVAVWVKLPDVPVTVMLLVAAVAALLAVSVSELVVVALAGLNDEVTPAGKPEADRATLPAKLFWGAIVMVLEPLAPCAIVRLLAASVKSAAVGGVTGAGDNVYIVVEKILLVLNELVFSPVT